MISRRDFLKASALSASAFGGVSVSDAFAATSPNDYKTLIHVYLDGGNDGFNMLVPTTATEHNTYKRSRRELAFEISDLLPISPNGYGANSFGLHPELTGIQRLFNDGLASFITGMGPLTEPLTKTDILQGAALPRGITGHAGTFSRADHGNNINTAGLGGIGGRMAFEFNVPTAKLPANITVGGNFDLFNAHSTIETYNANLTGLITAEEYDVSRGDFQNAKASAFRRVNDEIIAHAQADKHLLLQHYANVSRNGLDLNVDLQRDFANLPDVTGDFSISNSNAFKAAAELLAGRKALGMKRQVISLTLGGFDTHTNHLDGHADLMRQFNQDFTALIDAIIGLGLEDSVTVVTNSEFGRTLTSTGDGTDHAWANNQIIVGGAIKSREIFGTFPSLELGGADDSRDSGRMIPTMSTSQIFSTIATWMGVPDNRLTTVVPSISNFPVRNMGFYSV